MGLDIIELVLAVEEQFHIEIEAAEATEIQTVGDLHGVILRRAGVPAGSPTEGEIWSELRLLIVAQTALPLDEITAEARLLDDLGLD